MLESGICELIQNVKEQIFRLQCSLILFSLLINSVSFLFCYISGVNCNKLFYKYHQNRNKSKIQSFITFKEMADIICLFNNLLSNIFYYFLFVYVICHLR